MTTTAHSPEYTQAPDKKSSPNRLKGPKALVLVGALSASAAILAACGAETQAKPQPVATEEVPVAEAPVEGVNNETEEEPTPTTTFEIPSGLEAQALGEYITENVMNEWNNASAEDSLLLLTREDEHKNKSWEQLTAELAQANAEARADAYFVDGWESNPNLVNAVKGFTTANDNTLQWFAATAWSDKPENTEGFKVWSTTESVSEIPDADPNDNLRTIDIIQKDYTNSDKNTGPEPSREGGAVTITLEDQGDGTEKISDFTVR